MTTPTEQTNRNALTVDVEDWVQSVFDHDAPVTRRFVDNTERILQLFDRCGVRGTFFVLGLCAQEAPELVRRIQSCGHEVQSHGFAHRSALTQSESAFREDIDRARKLLQDITGTDITAYRAPSFSITQRNLWTLDAIANAGYSVDASICPARTRRYGIGHAPHHPHRIVTPTGRTLLEVPVTTRTLFGKRIPAGGGGYLRLYPMGVIRRAIDRINQEGAATCIYMHPYEFAPREIAELRASGEAPRDIPWKTRLHQGLGRRGFAGKVEGLIRSGRFGTIGQLLKQSAVWSCFRYERDGIITKTNLIKSASRSVTSGPVRSAPHATGEPTG